MSNKYAHGFTLVEMVIAIVIVGVGLAGVLTAFNNTVKSSADPLIHKQMLAVAEEMMEEVLLKPFAVNGTAPVNSLKGCGSAAPPSRAAFDDVSDYNNYSTTGICDIDGAAVAGLSGYNISVAVGNAALGGIAASSVLKVTVTVTHGAESIVLAGWRTNYAL
jgi:MSHA pilin protein MshD